MAAAAAMHAGDPARNAVAPAAARLAGKGRRARLHDDSSRRGRPHRSRCRRSQRGRLPMLSYTVSDPATCGRGNCSAGARRFRFLGYTRYNRPRSGGNGHCATGSTFVRPLIPMIISGREVLPLVEGGKGISVSNGESSGAWAASGAVGTFSGVNADSFTADGQPIPQIYHGRTRRERHEELIAYAIAGGIHQARVAHEKSNGGGRIHVNVLWEMAAAEKVLSARRAGRRSRSHSRRHLRRRDALSHGRNLLGIWRLLLSDRLFGARLSRVMEACLSQIPAIGLAASSMRTPWLAGGHMAGLSNGEDPAAAGRPPTPVCANCGR